MKLNLHAAFQVLFLIFFLGTLLPLNAQEIEVIPGAEGAEHEEMLPEHYEEQQPFEEFEQAEDSSLLEQLPPFPELTTDTLDTIIELGFLHTFGDFQAEEHESSQEEATGDDLTSLLQHEEVEEILEFKSGDPLELPENPKKITITVTTKEKGSKKEEKKRITVDLGDKKEKRNVKAKFPSGTEVEDEEWEAPIKPFRVGLVFKRKGKVTVSRSKYKGTDGNGKTKTSETKTVEVEITDDDGRVVAGGKIKVTKDTDDKGVETTSTEHGGFVERGKKGRLTSKGPLEKPDIKKNKEGEVTSTTVITKEYELKDNGAVRTVKITVTVEI